MPRYATLELFAIFVLICSGIAIAVARDPAQDQSVLGNGRSPDPPQNIDASQVPTQASAISNAQASADTERPRGMAPATISKQAQAFLQAASPKSPPVPQDLSGWRSLRSEMEGLFSARNKELVEKYVARIDIEKMAGVDVHVITPKNFQGDAESPALLYVHGGAYVFGSAKSSYCVCAPIAARLGCRVYAVDYRLAPEHPYPAGLDDTVAVYTALAKEFSPKGIGVLGESAGGSLSLAMLLKAHQAGVSFPAAVVSISPWADLSNTGDTYTTLAGLDPVLGSYDKLAAAARAYAAGTDPKDPFVSPVYAEYSQDFPPILIQTGTRDLFLSNCSRLSQRMKQAKVQVELSVWEGMWHVFTIIPPVDFPEAEQAQDEIADFLREHLLRKRSG